jgi:thiol-disulfide isomerase/thioredoxin
MHQLNYSTLLLITSLLLFSHPSLVYSDPNNSITVYTFDEFEPWLHKDTDSLYVINFWATWCAPCVKEIPDFEKINAMYKDKKVKVLFVSLDFPNQIESRVVPFMDRLNMQAQVVLLNDPRANRWIPLVSEQWTGAIPATVIYGNGFREFYEREFKFEELEEIILPLISSN